MSAELSRCRPDGALHFQIFVRHSLTYAVLGVVFLLLVVDMRQSFDVAFSCLLFKPLSIVGHFEQVEHRHQ